MHISVGCHFAKGTYRSVGMCLFISKTYDRINLTVPKGHKEEIKAHADAQKESVNSFINRAIDETMERDNPALQENTNAHNSESKA